MLNKLFWQDPYLSECNATITSVNNDIVTVDQTVAYAFSGGQESDTGTIGGYEILEANKKGFDIEYTLLDHDLKVNDEVIIKIDWPRRYKMMRLHFVGDLALQIILTKYPDIVRIGAHVSENKVRMDFMFEENISSLFDWVNEELNKLIEKDLAITTAFEDEATQRRYWSIDGYTAECGGTHIRTTSEIGKVKFKRKNLGNSKERIEISLLD